MLTTAKSIQLLDASGLNISPITDITSLYYEVKNPANSGIISRKYVYSGFPVGVNIETGQAANIATEEAERGEIILYDETNGFRKLIDRDTQNDILVSNVSVNIIPGTVYRQIDVKNYNLSEMLLNYTPLDLMDSSFINIYENIEILDTSIRDLSTAIDTIVSKINAEKLPLQTIIDYANHGQLIQNKFYIVTDYFVGSGSGCMDIPDNGLEYEYAGLNISEKCSILVKAAANNQLDCKIYEIYDKNNNPLNVRGTYKIINNGTKNVLRITYMKDQFGNEAPYDIYNIRVRVNGSGLSDPCYTFSYAEHSLLPTYGQNVKNNIIKTNPYETTFAMPVFLVISLDDPAMPDTGVSIKDNYLGENNNFFISGDKLSINNTIIGNNNVIKIGNYIYTLTSIQNLLIGNNNNLLFENEYNSEIVNNNFIIKNNNNIHYIKKNNNESKNIVFDSSNNITFYDQAALNNIVILNNNDTSIYASGNDIVVSECINSTITPSENSAYLYNQNIFAKSFNTI